MLHKYLQGTGEEAHDGQLASRWRYYPQPKHQQTGQEKPTVSIKLFGMMTQHPNHEHKHCESSYCINCSSSSKYEATAISSCCLLTNSTNVGSSIRPRCWMGPFPHCLLESLYANSTTPATNECDLTYGTKGAHSPDNSNVHRAYKQNTFESVQDAPPWK